MNDALFRAGALTAGSLPAAAERPVRTEGDGDAIRAEGEWLRGGALRSRTQPSRDDDFWARIAARDSPRRSDLDRLARDEEFKLIQRVFRPSGSAKGQTVLFAAVDHTSAGPLVCGRTAEVLAAQVEGSVCVADADLREPMLHEYFGAPPAHGLLDLLREGGSARNAALQVSANLWLLSAEASLSDPQTVVASHRMRVLVKELRDQFDYVLISAPPFSQRAESTLLSQLSDGVVLVVEAHATRRERARSVRDNLAAAGVPLLGVVLNNRTFPIPDAVYRRL